MRHPPTQLALLISLIGLGVSPYACARTELRVADPLPSALDTALAPPVETTVLDRMRWVSSDLAWEIEEGALDASMPLPGLERGPFDDDSAPGETAHRPDRAAVRAGAVTARDERAAPDGSEGIEPAAAEVDEKRVRRFVVVERVAPMREIAEPNSSSPPMARSERVPVTPAIAPDTWNDSAHADRLLEVLAAIVLDDVPASHSDLVLARLAERFPASFADAPEPVRPRSVETVEPPPSTPAPATAAPRVEPREFVVESASCKVLRTLEAILSPECDAVGAIRIEPEFVATHSEKVLAMLGDVLHPPAKPEEGFPRRARKLAALQARAQAAGPSAAASVPVAAPAITPAIAPAVATAIAPTPAALPPNPEPKVRPSPFGGERVAMSEASLDGVRGGFVTENLNISFGIERAVYVNGTLITTTTFNVSDLGRITAGQASATKIDAGTMAVVQNGAGNVVAPANLSPTSIGTVVQNTLDGQKVQTVTVINATVNSVNMLRSLNLQSSLRSAVIDSLRR